MSVTLALDVLCPRCGSSPGTPCYGVTAYAAGTRLSTTHEERIEAARTAPQRTTRASFYCTSPGTPERAAEENAARAQGVTLREPDAGARALHGIKVPVGPTAPYPIVPTLGPAPAAELPERRTLVAVLRALDECTHADSLVFHLDPGGSPSTPGILPDSLEICRACGASRIRVLPRGGGARPWSRPSLARELREHFRRTRVCDCGRYIATEGDRCYPCTLEARGAT